MISAIIPLETVREAFELGRSARSPGKIVLTVTAEDWPGRATRFFGFEIREISS
jgi:hypothetical protein